VASRVIFEESQCPNDRLVQACYLRQTINVNVPCVFDADQNGYDSLVTQMRLLDMSYAPLVGALYGVAALGRAMIGTAVGRSWTSEKATRYVMVAILLFAGLSLMLGQVT
jgi:hypothetical protein